MFESICRSPGKKHLNIYKFLFISKMSSTSVQVLSNMSSVSLQVLSNMFSINCRCFQACPPFNLPDAFKHVIHLFCRCFQTYPLFVFAGAFRVEMKRQSQKDRTINCRYEPREVGDYIISVKWSGEHVPGSPFRVQIFDTQSELERFLRENPERRTNAPQLTNGWEDDF